MSHLEGRWREEQTAELQPVQEMLGWGPPARASPCIWSGPAFTCFQGTRLPRARRSPLTLRPIPREPVWRGIWVHRRVSCSCGGSRDDHVQPCRGGGGGERPLCDSLTPWTLLTCGGGGFASWTEGCGG